MARKKKCRNLRGAPCCNGFKPMGIPSQFLQKITITLDELESIRLADYENLDHEEASGKLGVSRPVFTRLVDTARKKVAKALIEGQEIIIEGGDYHFHKKSFRCMSCFRFFELGINEADPEICPECGSDNIINLNNYFGGRGRCSRHGHTI